MLGAASTVSVARLLSRLRDVLDDASLSACLLACAQECSDAAGTARGNSRQLGEELLTFILQQGLWDKLVSSEFVSGLKGVVLPAKKLVRHSFLQAGSSASAAINNVVGLLEAGALGAQSIAVADELLKQTRSWTQNELFVALLRQIVTQMDTFASAGAFLSLFFHSEHCTLSSTNVELILGGLCQSPDVRDLGGEPEDLIQRLPEYRVVLEATLRVDGSDASDADSEGNLAGFVVSDDEAHAMHSDDVSSGSESDTESSSSSSSSSSNESASPPRRTAVKRTLHGHTARLPSTVPVAAAGTKLVRRKQPGRIVSDTDTDTDTESATASESESAMSSSHASSGTESDTEGSNTDSSSASGSSKSSDAAVQTRRQLVGKAAAPTKSSTSKPAVGTKRRSAPMSAPSSSDASSSSSSDESSHSAHNRAHGGRQRAAPASGVDGDSKGARMVEAAKVRVARAAAAIQRASDPSQPTARKTARKSKSETSASMAARRYTQPEADEGEPTDSDT